MIFVKKFDFCQKFRFWSKISTLVKNFNFGQKFRFWSKISIFVKNLDLCTKCRFCPTNSMSDQIVYLWSIFGFLKFRKTEFCPADVRSKSNIFADDWIQPIAPTIELSSPDTSANDREVHRIIEIAEKFVRQNRRQKGLDLLEHAHKIDPKNAEVLVLLGTTKMEMNEVADADRYLSRALQGKICLLEIFSFEEMHIFFNRFSNRNFRFI